MARGLAGAIKLREKKRRTLKQSRPLYVKTRSEMPKHHTASIRQREVLALCAGKTGGLRPHGAFDFRKYSLILAFYWRACALGAAARLLILGADPREYVGAID
jgi:hypothetical protein